MKFFTALLLCVCVSVIWANLVPINHNSAKPIQKTRIVGGQVAEVSQFPWEAALHIDRSDGQYFCGGSLIYDQWILTAGQCVHGAVTVTIQLGSNSLKANDINRITLTSSTFILHENFSVDPLVYDIALIKLDSPVTSNDYIQSIKIANVSYLFPDLSMVSAGWGQINDASTDLSDQLNFVSVSVMSQPECKVYYGGQLLSHMVCAVGHFNEGICFGDIGGPLVARAILDHPLHTAIASFMSKNGCESTDPKGYVRTDYFYGWINEQIAASINIS